MSAALIRSDATAIPLGNNTVDLIVTSPPYFALRSYQDGGEHYGGQIGSEATPAAFLEALWAVTAECWRVLKPSGSLFVNLGDKYAGNNTGGALSSSSSTLTSTVKDVASGRRRSPYSATVRSKSLMGLPWRYAIGCIDGQADPDGRGWVLRSEIVWSKPNGLPESVTDRVRRSHEQWFHLTKEGRYYSNVDEVREPHETPLHSPGTQKFNADRNDNDKGDRIFGNPLGKLPGSVWTVPTQPLIVPDWLDVDHFAAFPTEWPRRLILGWSPPGICVECGEGRRAVVDRESQVRVPSAAQFVGRRENAPGTDQGANRAASINTIRTITGTACACGQADRTHHSGSSSGCFRWHRHHRHGGPSPRPLRRVLRPLRRLPAPRQVADLAVRASRPRRRQDRRRTPRRPVRRCRMTALTHARTDDTSTPASPVDNHPHARWFPVVPEWFRNHRSVVRSPVVPVVPYPVGMGTTTGEPLTPWELPRNRPHSGTTDGTTHRPTQETAP